MAVDALRDREPASPTGETAGPLPVDRLRAAGLEGVLVWTDAACRLRALRLPGGAAAPVPSGPDVDCEFELSPDGTRVAPRGARWGTSAFYAVCRAETVEVRVPPNLRPQYVYAGCTPAWRPSRQGPPALTVVQEGEVVEVQPACEGQPPCREVLIGGDELRTAAGTPYEILDVRWPGTERADVRLRLGAREVVATFEAGELVLLRPAEEVRERVRVVDGDVLVGGVRLPLRARDAAFAPDAADRELASELEAQGVFGTLVSTSAAGCRLGAVQLPGLGAAPVPSGGEGVGCVFELSPDASRVAATGSAWSPDGRLVARCVGGGTWVEEVATGREVYRVDGCAPSWRAPNTLVVAEGEHVVQWLVDCHRGRSACRRLLLGPAALEAAAARHVNAPDDSPPTTVRIVDTAWLAPDRLAVLLSAAYVYPETTLGPFETVAVFAGRRLAGTFASLGPPLGGLEANRQRRVLLALPDTLLDSDAREAPLPGGFGDVRAGALSPDGRWLALAARGAVVILSTDGSPGQWKLPIAAADVAWR